ncbi:type II toxin-antitoxin system RelE/ParE family toxin [Bdellovibrio sp. HCB290]|uniref:type II toxin-antitoxin system RelE/ParE family toxin n=1 Tax=Bdellovibrio sp. HCB290 TaxID=3394356 RepID=UPI0039B5A88D
MAIQSFSDPLTEQFFESGRIPSKAGWRNVHSVVQRKLDLLHFAAKLEDLKSPPGNRLEALKGSLAGFYSVRINDQWRCIFKWTDEGPTDVEICDYH